MGLELAHDIDAKDMITDALIILQVMDHETGRTYPVCTHTMESSLVMVDGLWAQYPRYRDSLEDINADPE